MLYCIEAILYRDVRAMMGGGNVTFDCDSVFFCHSSSSMSSRASSASPLAYRNVLIPKCHFAFLRYAVFTASATYRLHVPSAT